MKCPNCGSTNTLYTKKDNAFWCRKCGNVWKKPVVEKKWEKLDGKDHKVGDGI